MDIKKIQKDSSEKIKNINNLEALELWHKNFLGKKSELSQISKNLKNLKSDEKKEIGQKIGELRKSLTEIYEQSKNKLEKENLAKNLEADWIDVTKTRKIPKGSLHPISIMQKEVEQIFSSMGFSIKDGPHLESEWNNFDALNISNTHPARDMQDTFWVKNDSKNSRENLVLRTHTSPVQIRTMLENGAPSRIIVPGRVFRNEDVDATHDVCFYQVEGLLVDENISLAHLKSLVKKMLELLFKKEVKVRIRPGYFPFVEPGFEVDMWWEFEKDGKKCGKWLEFMGAGMIHPNVLENCQIDTKKYSGFAFGFGLTRLAMMKYQIDDIRLLSSMKIDFLKQF